MVLIARRRSGHPQLSDPAAGGGGLSVVITAANGRQAPSSLAVQQEPPISSPWTCACPTWTARRPSTSSIRRRALSGHPGHRDLRGRPWSAGLWRCLCRQADRRRSPAGKYQAPDRRDRSLAGCRADSPPARSPAHAPLVMVVDDDPSIRRYLVPGHGTRGLFA